MKEDAGKQSLVLSIVAIAAFHLAFLFAPLRFLIAVYLYCMCRLAHTTDCRRAIGLGLGIGLATGAAQLYFFWEIFSTLAIFPWLVVSL